MQKRPACAHGETGQASGSLIVVVLLLIVATTAGGLIWYKQQPQALPPALNNDNGVMLLVPAGPFLHGPDKEQGVAPAFYIDRIEVPNSIYSKFCSATRRPLPPDFPQNRPNDPVVNITIEDASAFAKWAGKRLPDALEWEKAYGGASGRRYPWGDAPEARRSAVSDNPALPERKVQPADSMTEGGSPYNILQMAGNVAEYVRTPVNPADSASREPWYQARGGSFREPLEAALPWKSRALPASFRASDVGFRCVKDPPRR